VLFDVETHTRPIATAYIGPSVTPYTDLNPGFRIYELDAGATKLVTQTWTYIADLIAANKVGACPRPSLVSLTSACPWR
jgi:sphingomyelin phosphodiesterase